MRPRGHDPVLCVCAYCQDDRELHRLRAAFADVAVEKGLLLAKVKRLEARIVLLTTPDPDAAEPTEVTAATALRRIADALDPEGPR